MTATDTLCAMLDRYEVEYETFSGAFATKTCWPCANGLTAIFVEYDEGTTRFEMSRWHVAPEQAIAATLGAGTCHIEQTGHVKVACVDYYDDDYECSECGAEMFEGYNFCPNCGRRVVDE